MPKYITIHCNCGHDYEIQYNHHKELYAEAIKATCPKCNLPPKFKRETNMSGTSNKPNEAKQMSFHEQKAKQNEIVGIENPNKPTAPDSHLRLMVDLKTWHIFPIVRKHLKSSQTTSQHEFGWLCFVFIYSFKNELLLK